MSEEELMEEIFGIIIDYTATITLSNFLVLDRSYEKFTKHNRNKFGLHNIICYGTDKEELSYLFFRNPYNMMSSDCQEFVDKVCALVTSYKLDDKNKSIMDTKPGDIISNRDWFDYFDFRFEQSTNFTIREITDELFVLLYYDYDKPITLYIPINIINENFEITR